MHYPKIYKRTTVGKIQEWHRELDETNACYRTISGQLDGNLVTSGWSQATPKNVGKTNETTALEQARLEIEADYKKKLAQGQYRESIDDIDTKDFFKPMLAQTYEKYAPLSFSRLDKYSQPKLDGVRCIATEDGLFSRQGKVIESCPHISEALVPVFAANPGLIVDGELYADKLSQDFNKIISLVKKKSPKPEAIIEAASIVEFHVYDLPSFKGGFEYRYLQLEILLQGIPSVVLVDTSLISSQSELDDLNGHYIEQGYEGQIIRIGGIAYEQKRSKQLLKRKTFDDAEYEIVSINEGDGNRSGMAGFITYKNTDGTTFGSGIKGSHEYAKQLLVEADEYVGGVGTVKYFGLTPDGVPRFPVTIALYKEGRDS